jgi:hypothetical protein
MKRKPGIEKLMKTRADLRELGGRVLLGDYPAENGLSKGAGAPGSSGESLEMIALTFCRPGLAWVMDQLKGIFISFPDSEGIMKKLSETAGKITETGRTREKDLMLALIGEAENMTDDKMAGRLGKILSSVKGLSPMVKDNLKSKV